MRRLLRRRLRALREVCLMNVAASSCLPERGAPQCVMGATKLPAEGGQRPSREAYSDGAPTDGPMALSDLPSDSALIIVADMSV
jgi:hypothetical protein